MARAPNKIAPTLVPANAVVSWDEELARAATIAGSMEAGAGGLQFFSMQAGQLSFNDMPVPGNQMAVVVLDYILENIYYTEKWEAGNPLPPTCFAFGREDHKMTPHPVVFEHQQEQNAQCRDCPRNEWASAETGRGKACRNTRRLAVISAGTLDPQTARFTAFDDPQHYADAPIQYLKLPVTSVKPWSGYVKQLIATVKRPPFGVFTRIRVVPDSKTQFRVECSALSPISDDLRSVIMTRHADAEKAIDFPYALDAGDDALGAAPRTNTAAKKY